MTTRINEDWSHRIEQVIRSRHYTWLGEGLGGMPIKEAIVTLMADLMHICKHEGIPWDHVAELGSEQFAEEEDLLQPQA